MSCYKPIFEYFEVYGTCDKECAHYNNHTQPCPIKTLINSGYCPYKATAKLKQKTEVTINV